MGQLVWQLAGVAADFVWSMATCSLMFWTMNYFGIFRVSEQAERMGMDLHHHGGTAYKRESAVTSSATNSKLFLTENGTADVENVVENGNDSTKVHFDGVVDKGNEESKQRRSRISVESADGLRRRHSSTTLS